MKSLLTIGLMFELAMVKHRKQRVGVNMVEELFRENLIGEYSMKTQHVIMCINWTMRMKLRDGTEIS
jgi:hypothetical protein